MNGQLGLRISFQNGSQCREVQHGSLQALIHDIWLHTATSLEIRAQQNSQQPEAPGSTTVL